MCDTQSQKKYTERPSPPYPANECCGEEKIGNDGKLYRSEKNARGICTWKQKSPQLAHSDMYSTPTYKRRSLSPPRAPKKQPSPSRFSKTIKTVPELRAIARERKLKGYSRMKREELLHLLKY